jgi:hypothetical protein
MLAGSRKRPINAPNNRNAMYLYVEMWSAKPSWLALSLAEREQFMAKVAAAGPQVAALGAELIGSWRNDEDVDQRLAKNYFIAFRLPDKAAAQAMEAIVRGSGWYDYFDQHNSGGQADGFEAVMAHAMAL